MKILLILSILLTISACEIEKLEPSDVIAEDPPGWNSGTPVIAPEDIVIPCTLQPNLVRFNNANTTITNVSVNPPFLGSNNSHYAIRVPLVSSQDLEILFFSSLPATGYYTTVSELDTFPTQVQARVFTGGSYYYGNPGASLYVQNYGDSIRISYCDIDFTNSFTIPNSKAQFVY